MTPPGLFFFFKIVLATLGFLHFHTNFKILCSSSGKSAIGILMEIALNRQIALHKMVGNCKNINFPIHEHGVPFHLLV